MKRIFALIVPFVLVFALSGCVLEEMSVLYSRRGEQDGLVFASIAYPVLTKINNITKNQHNSHSKTDPIGSVFGLGESGVRQYIKIF